MCEQDLNAAIEDLDAAVQDLDAALDKARPLPFKAIIRIETWDEDQLDLLSDHLAEYKGMKVEWYMTED